MYCWRVQADGALLPRVKTTSVILHSFPGPINSAAYYLRSLNGSWSGSSRTGFSLHKYLDWLQSPCPESHFLLNAITGKLWRALSVVVLHLWYALPRARTLPQGVSWVLQSCPGYRPGQASQPVLVQFRIAHTPSGIPKGVGATLLLVPCFEGVPTCTPMVNKMGKNSLLRPREAKPGLLLLKTGSSF